jgi:hypothetical protein
MIFQNRLIIMAVGVLSTTALLVSLYLLLNPGKKLVCQKESCTNLDARYYKCAADAKTILAEKVNRIDIELRYSRKCDASWSRAIVPPGSRIYVEDTQGKKYGDNYVIPLNDPIKGAHYGNMGPGRSLKACVQIPQNQHYCTKLAD